jgi:hypothetical protein
MATKTVVKPTEGASLAQRQTALAVVRGLRLAVHSAAGLTKDVDVEAMRLMRVIEGLVITVAGRLQSLGRGPSLAAGAPAAAAAAEAAAAAAAGTGAPDDGKSNNQLPTDNGKSKKAGKKKTKKKVKKDAEMGIAVVPGASAPLSGDAAVSTPSQDGLMDEWADTLPTVYGPAPAPVGFVVPIPAAASVPAPPPPRTAVLALAALREPGLRPRPLIARKSGTPPRKCGLGEPEPLSERITASPLLAGSIAAVVGLTSRPDLEGAYVELLEYDSAARRWICRTAKKEQVRVVPEKLQSFQPGLFQQLAQTKFEADGKMAMEMSKVSNDAAMSKVL